MKHEKIVIAFYHHEGAHPKFADKDIELKDATTRSAKIRAHKKATEMGWTPTGDWEFWQFSNDHAKGYQNESGDRRTSIVHLFEKEPT